MDPSTPQPVTQLLAQWRDGDERAFAQLSGIMYEELRQLAQSHLRRERSNHTMQKTALVNEAFVRLVGQQSVDWQSRAQPAKALPFYERALSLVEPIAAANPDDAELQRGRAFVLASIGDLQNDLQRPREGLANYDRALAIIEPLRAADADDQLTPQATAFLLNGRGESHLLLSDLAAALHDFSRAETIVRNGPPPQPTDISEIRMLPGITCAKLATGRGARSKSCCRSRRTRWKAATPGV